MKNTRPPVEPRRTAQVAGVSPGAWCVYADGYKRAAEILVANVKTTYELNTVIFPMIFLYRQYAELTLKEIIGYCRYLDNASLGAPGGHDLRQLWREARTLIRRHLSDVPQSDLHRVEVHMNTLIDLDPSSESSRYPRVKGRAASFRFDTRPVNVDQFAADMAALAKLLEPLGSTLAVYRDYESDLRSYGSDY